MAPSLAKRQLRRVLRPPRTLVTHFLSCRLYSGSGYIIISSIVPLTAACQNLPHDIKPRRLPGGHPPIWRAAANQARGRA